MKPKLPLADAYVFCEHAEKAFRSADAMRRSMEFTAGMPEAWRAAAKRAAAVAGDIRKLAGQQLAAAIRETNKAGKDRP